MLSPNTILPNALAFIDVEATSLGARAIPSRSAGAWVTPVTWGASSFVRLVPLRHGIGTPLQQVHGIGHLTLLRDGQNSGPAARQFAEATKGRRFFADSKMDGWWMRRLFKTAKLTPPPTVEDFRKLLNVIVRPEPTVINGDPIALGLARADRQGALVDRAYQSARRTAPTRHRAGDARHLHAALQGAVTRRVV
jgi:hypothetical protein